MPLSPRAFFIVKIIAGITLLLSIAFGISLGLAMAATRNIDTMELIGDFQPAIPSQILDRNGTLITELFSEEKREIVSINELPKHLIHALITREDQEFFSHNGFSIRGTVRAAWNVLTGRYFSGGSTITQQLAGHMYADRSDITITRKLVELWWAFQLERSLTKYEILEKYLNKMFFGSGVYGVEAASQFYFGHSARELTLAESVVLVVQLASPARYNPIRHPNRLRRIQQEILSQMVELGYTTQQEADLSYEEYWNNYDFTRSNTATAFFEREDAAPYFSEFVRQQLEESLFGALNIYRDGFIVHTTLNLDYQKIADRHMATGIAQINTSFRTETARSLSVVEADYIPVIDLLSLVFDIDQIRVAGAKEILRARQTFSSTVTPTLDIVSLMFGIDDLRFVSKMSYAREQQKSQRTTVEGALITIDNRTGHILAMVGGSRFESINQFNRAVQAEVQPGSAFKPLYYAAAIEHRKLTPATLLYDAPVVFWNDDGTPYAPQNFRGEWKGPVLARTAMARSMNIPSIKVLDMVGFDHAISTAAALLGISAPEQIARVFPRVYPLALGINRTSPLAMARAFATFAAGGREVVPIGIRYIEDRNGKIIAEPEKDIINQQRRKGRAAQILSPQTAYIMTDMLVSTVNWGTLSYARNSVRGFSMPMAGKTGTTQNWSDAWTVGYSPYYTTAVWFGFDRPGSSLGVRETGALAAGPVWASVMKDIHSGLKPMDFERPAGGITEMHVTARSGLLPPAGFSGNVVKELFIAGTEPRRFDDIEEFERERDQQAIERMRRAIMPQDLGFESAAIPPFELRLDPLILPDFDLPDTRPSTSGDPGYNPLLD